MTDIKNDSAVPDLQGVGTTSNPSSAALEHSDEIDQLLARYQHPKFREVCNALMTADEPDLASTFKPI